MKFYKLYFNSKIQKNILKGLLYFYLGISVFLGLGVLYFDSFSFQALLIMLGVILGCFLIKKLIFAIDNYFVLYNENKLIINKPFKKEVTFNWEDFSHYNKSSREFTLYDFNNNKILTIYTNSEGFISFYKLVTLKNIPQKDFEKKEIIKKILLGLVMCFFYIVLKFF